MANKPPYKAHNNLVRTLGQLYRNILEVFAFQLSQELLTISKILKTFGSQEGSLATVIIGKCDIT